ncbi:MAG: hypothetical protein ABI132_09195 [Rhodanobacteraceae bacterium]
MSVRRLRFALVILGAVIAAPLLAAPSASDGKFADSLQWRLLGPFRGGWGTMAQGIPDQPNVYYFGAAGGGVWKTIDAGRTWQSLGDHLPAAAVGAIAVASSNANVIYVGTGQVAARYDVAAGSGVFVSRDGGKSWQGAGLAATRNIGKILIDPRDANTVLVGALGHYFGPNHERGVFRSTDGGKTWKQTLYIDDDTGVVDLAADPSNPNVIYAAAWQVRNYPWLSYFQPNSGPGSGVYKSSDGGATWKHLNGNGWPTGELGRIGLAAASGNRVYAVVNAAPNSGNVPHPASKNQGGLYRSDDGGVNWKLVSGEGWLENDYFSRINVDPHNADVVYSAGQSIRRSSDGGKTWTIIKGAPGGDDYHNVWINPKYPDHMITASDQGVVVTVDGGKTWSDWYNQPTGQFYHLAADNRFPYWVYSGQQDSGTVGIASRSDYGALSFRDWHPVGGDERDYDVPDALDPMIVYGSGLGGRVSRFDARTGQVANVSPWPIVSYGARPTTSKYRYTWITPLVAVRNHQNQSWLYLGAQVLFRSTDRGDHWNAISPDLTGQQAGAKNCDGKVAIADARACGYGVIFSIALSSRDDNEIWTGSDSGLIYLTRDGGAHWNDVTPKSLPEWNKIASMDVSALQAGTAYAATDGHRHDDFSPHVWRTHDYGKSWVEVDNGLPKDHFVDVVRADPERAGLLYAGTDAGVCVSFDDGDHWQSLRQNLPTAWVRDLLVHGDDLIVATQGRAIWVLDDLSSLRQWNAGIASQPQHLFKPADALRVHTDNNKDTPPPPETPLGKNPPDGAIIDYSLGSNALGPVTIDILDANGKRIRHFASDARPEDARAERYFDEDWLKPAPVPATTVGMHRFVWNLRYPRPRAASYDYSIAAVFGEDTPTAPQGAFVLPGQYTVALKANGREQRQTFNVAMDPRVHVSDADLRAALAFSQSVDAALGRAYIGYAEQKAVGKQLDALDKQMVGQPSRKSLHDEVAALWKKMQSDANAKLDQSLGFVNISGALASLETDAESADTPPSSGQQQVLQNATDRLQNAQAQWQALRDGDFARLNASLKTAGMKPIIVPPLGKLNAGEPDSGVDLP